VTKAREQVRHAEEGGSKEQRSDRLPQRKQHAEQQRPRGEQMQSVLAVGTPLPVKIFETDAYGQLVAPNFKVTCKEKLETQAEEGTFRFEGGEAAVKFEAGAPKLAVTQALIGQKGTLEFAEGRKPWLFSF
jgi:hypothetical protein